LTAIAVVSPGYPGSPGGVTDHTARLVESWTGNGETVHVFGDVSEPIASLARRFEAAHTEALLIQYVPFLFGKRGISPFQRNLVACCKRLGIRVTTFVHEPCVPPTRLPWLILSQLQKRQLRQLIALSDATVTAVPAWAGKLGPATQTVYVGSTLGDPPENIESEPQLPSPMVFSPFASGLQWDAQAASDHTIVGRYASDSWDYRGRVAADEALSLLARARLVLAPFVDGLTGRRTSAMASLSCGSRLLTSAGHLSDPTFGDGPAVIAGSKEEFVQAACAAWENEESASDREQRQSWYRDHCSAAHLDNQLLTIVAGRSRG